MFMKQHVSRAFSDSSHHVRACVCACFTLLRCEDWTMMLLTVDMPRHEAKTTNMSSSRSRSPIVMDCIVKTPLDTSPVVRAAGFRLLGALALLAPFKVRFDTIFIVQCGEQTWFRSLKACRESEKKKTCCWCCMMRMKLMFS